MTPDYVRRQLDVVCSDITPAAAKTGALGAAGIIDVVAAWARETPCPLVVDPVMISKHGKRLLEPDARGALIERLLPHAALVTPNVPEAEDFAGLPIRSLDDMAQAARRILALGPAAVLLKGGHLEAVPGQSIGLLLTPTGEERFVSGEKGTTPDFANGLRRLARLADLPVRPGDQLHL